MKVKWTELEPLYDRHSRMRPGVRAGNIERFIAAPAGYIDAHFLDRKAVLNDPRDHTVEDGPLIDRARRHLSEQDDSKSVRLIGRARERVAEDETALLSSSGQRCGEAGVGARVESARLG